MLTPDTLLQNRYLILRLLAQGGMGAVYEARDQRLGNIVALKESFFTEETLRQAFHREASLLATLRHPALPKVIDHFTEGDGQFLVMEFIRGDDLARLLELSARPIAQADVLVWADQLLGALEYLHAQRPPIIHRDIKPQNLKLNERAEIILLDFGLAKEAALDASQLNPSVRGYTLKYAPLEQIQGTGTDPRSDLYSAAATLYHLLTAITPADALTRVTAIVESQPDPLLPAHQVNPKVSVAVSGVLQQALMLDRNRRLPNASAMRLALRQAAEGKSSGASPPMTELPTQRMTEVSPEPQPALAGQNLSTAAYSLPPKAADPVKSYSTVAAPKPIAQAPEVGFQPSPAKGRAKVWIAVAVAFILVVVAAIAFWPGQNGANKTTDTTSTKDGAKTVMDAASLSTREIISRGEGEESSYRFTALPGDLKLTLDVIGEGPTVTVEALDREEQPLSFNNKSSFSLASTGEHEQSVAHLLIDREQPVLLRVKTVYPQNLKAMRLRIEGPAKLPELAAVNSSPLAALFADRDKPQLLTTNVLFSGQSQKKENYYVFNAGPGEIKFTLNVIAAGAAVDVVLFDDQGEKLHFNNNSSNFSVSSSALNEQDSAQLVLDRQQKLLMRLHTAYPQSLRTFRLKLDGPIQLAQTGGNDAVATALAPVFAPRDNPEVFKGKELTGNRLAKEGYYRLIAGPGKMKVELEAECGGCGVTVELFDSEAKRLQFDNDATNVLVTSSGPKEKKSAEINLGREEALLVRLSANYPESMKEFRLKFDGAIKKQ